MADIKIPIMTIISAISDTHNDAELIINTCISRYLLYPVNKHNYVDNVIKDIFCKVTYAEHDIRTAVDNISKYFDYGKLIKRILDNHRIISTIVIAKHGGIVNNIKYTGVTDGVALFETS